MPADSSLEEKVDGTRPTRTVAGSGVLPLLLVGGMLAVAIAGALFTLAADPFGSTVAAVYGPIVIRVITEIASVLTVGSLLFAVFLAPPQRSGTLDVAGYAALRMAGWWAWLWFLGALLSVPFSAAAVGRPVSSVFDPRALADLVGLLPQPKAWLISAAVAVLIAGGARVVRSWGWSVGLFLLALLGIVPLAVTGHSSGRAQDLATSSLLLHLLAVSLWVGGLVALLAHGRRDHSRHLGVATARFSRIALVCWVVVAASGGINALTRVPLADLFTTSYGLLVVAKTGALLLLGVMGYLQRARGVRDVLAGGSGLALFRVAAVEVLIMLATVGIGAALARTPPPPVFAEPGQVELRVGYPLAGPPTLVRLLFDWRIDLIFAAAAGTAAVLYLLGVRRLRNRGDAWPVSRTVLWLLGCLVVVLATNSGFGRYAPTMFSVQLETHMRLSLLAPVLLVLGGPVTLALRALAPAGRDAPPGPREWLLALVHSPVTRALTHPIVALVLFAGSFPVLYLSGLFDTALEQDWAYLAINLHFLVVGYLFYWTVIGVDPTPRRLPQVARLGLVFASLPFHALFGVILMSTQTVIGERFYSGLALPWAADLLADQRLGGGTAWATGVLPLLVVLVALLMPRARAEEPQARQADRRLDGDAERTAEDAVLHQLAEGDRR